jgi:flagellar protein FlaG
MYLYSVKSTEAVRGIEVSDVKSLPGQSRTKHEAAHDAPPKENKGEKLAELQMILAQNNISMKFSTNEITSDVVVRLVDENTGEIIRQIPNEVSLKLAAVNIRLQGLMFDETV